MFELIAFDADDTLWQNERLYARAQEKLRGLLSSYCESAEIDRQLYNTELRNLEHYGYGIKSFALSMIETAIQLTGGRITGGDIQKILAAVQEMLLADVELLEHAQDTVANLSTSYTLMLVTKGDLLDQQRKIQGSGLGGYFKYIEIVSEKDSKNYLALLEKYGVAPQHFLMVGNSLKSDVFPVTAIGGQAVHIPYELTWEHENEVDASITGSNYYQLEHLGQLPGLIEQIASSMGN